jgi:RNA recognition motif-containing protein
MAAEEARKLFVAGLPDTITEDVLRQLFEATGGTVVEVSLPKDRTTGRPRGFGFVTLSTTDEAQAAREALDGSMQAGRSISVRPFQPEPPKRDGVAVAGGPPMRGGDRPGPSSPDRTIYVGNLPYDATLQEVETLFADKGVGPVARVSLPMDEDGRKRGFGFVSMPSAESANAAIEALRGADIRGRSLVVNLAYPKGERPAREGGPPGGGGYSPRPAGGFGGGGGGFSGGPPVGGGGGFGGPPRTGGGAPPRPGQQNWKKKKDGEGEGGRRTKTWDRERGGGGGGKIRGGDDWDKD